MRSHPEDFLPFLDLDPYMRPGLSNEDAFEM
jgi:hypothetical protein